MGGSVRNFLCLYSLYIEKQVGWNRSSSIQVDMSASCWTIRHCPDVRHFLILLTLSCLARFPAYSPVSELGKGYMRGYTVLSASSWIWVVLAFKGFR